MEMATETLSAMEAQSTSGAEAEGEHQKTSNVIKNGRNGENPSLEHGVASSASPSPNIAASSNSDDAKDAEQQFRRAPPSSSSSRESERPPQLPPRPQLDEDNIAKAESFLRNDEIRDLSTTSKRNYLQSKAGMSLDEIDVALERMAKKEGTMVRSAQYDRDDVNYRNRSRSREEYGSDSRRPQRYNDGGNDRMREDPRGYRRDTNQFYQDEPSRNPSRYGPMDQQQRRTSTPQYPPYDSNNVSSSYPPHGAPPGAGEPEEMPPTSLIPAVAGGFSLGVFLLAALRWLNGGDFVLFPPPMADFQPVQSHAIESIKEGDDGDEEDTHESDSQQPQNEDMEDNAEYIDDEASESEEDDAPLKGILDGASNVQSLHGNNNDNNQSQQQPSYDNLVLEIRSLTSAIHSYRDVQEKANRAVSAQVGKGMTDDAMDFLRQKKKKEDLDAGATVQALDEKGVASLASLLGEVSGDLTNLKESLSQTGEGSEAQASKSAGDADDATEATKIDKVGDDPSILLEEVMEKIQKLLSIVESKGSKGKGSVVDSSKKSEDEASEGEKKSVGEGGKPESDPITSESSLTPTTSLAPSADSMDDKTPQNESPTQEKQQPLNEDTTDAAQTTDSDQRQQQLDDALRTLSSNNTPADLKIGAQMLYLYCLNISRNPTIPRYRKIYTNNATFRNKVGNLVGYKEFLLAVGFAERGTSHFEWAPPEGNDDAGTKSRLDFALVALELMKNGSSAKKEEEELQPTTTEPKNQVVTEATSALSLSAIVSDPDVGKGMDLN